MGAVDLDEYPEKLDLVDVLVNGPRKLDCRLVAVFKVALVLVFAPGTA